MRSSSLLRRALAAPMLFTILFIARDSFATNTTSVQDGDTFLAIAYSAGISVESLEAANPGVAATDLFVGQVLNVPSNNEPATGTPASNPASSPATAGLLTTLITSPSPSMSFSPSPSVSSSPTPSVSATISSTMASSPTTSTMVSPTSTSISSSAPSKTTTNTSLASTSVSSSAPSTTPTSTSSSTISSSTTTSSSSTAPSTTSTTSSPSSTPATSTTSPPPPPSSPPPSTTVSVTPNSPPTSSVCRPTPTGQYHDAADVQSKTDAFCEQHGLALLEILQQNGTTIFTGDSQPKGYDGQNDEAGYNMTINVLPNCSVANATVMYPLPPNDDYNCTAILFDSWSTCYNNKGMGGSITAGCFVYSFDPDP